MLSREEIVARSKRLYPNYPVDPYTGTLNTPIEEAQSRYTNDASGGGWDQFFGQLQKQQEDAEAQGKTFKVGWGGFGNDAATADSVARGAAAMPRRTPATAYDGSLNPADLNPLEAESAKYAAMNQAASDEVDRQKAIKLAQDEAADRLQDKDISDLTAAYQNRVLDTTLAPPESPTTVTRTPGANGQPDTIAATSAPLTARERLLSAIPGHLRSQVEQTLQAMDLKQQQANREDAEQKEVARHNQAQEQIEGLIKPQKQQETLEQQYRTVLQRELSSRSGGLGMEDQKVNQAIHLNALMEQNRDPKTGIYNIPKAQFAELANGLATLVSPAGRPTDSMRSEIETRTAKGDFNGLLTYITGTPFSGSTQDMFKMLHDSIMRQGKVAQTNREGYFSAIRAMAPTDLAADRRQKVEAALKLNQLESPQEGTQQPIPGVAGGMAEFRNGKWIRVK